jgi:glutathione S-transferase
MNLRHCGLRVDAAKHPKVAAWSEAILSRPSLAPWVDKEERMMAKVLAA